MWVINDLEWRLESHGKKPNRKLVKSSAAWAHDIVGLHGGAFVQLFLEARLTE